MSIDKIEIPISRDVDNLRYPDKIYALGGAGIKMVSVLFQDDWFAIEGMRGGGGGGSIDIHFIDTATEGDENHKQEIQELQQRYNDYAGRMNEMLDGTVRDINITYHFLNSAIQIRKRAHITGSAFVNRILANTRADNWWVRPQHLDSRERPGQLYDISQGVIRRRALGKALHYKALAEQTNYRNEILSLTDRDQEIAIFSGLGGGTGSGLTIDIAEMVKDQRPTSNITLFTSLPSLEENPREKSNAYGALSELEYLHLDKDERNPFNNILLHPIDATGHDIGGTETKELVELDQALQYSIIGYYNNVGHDPALSGTTAYAPFTIAVPQVYRYKVRAINQAKKRAAEILETKREALDVEWELYSEIESFIQERYPNAEEGKLTAEDLEALRQRLREFKNLVELEIFSRLDYDPAKEGQELLDQIHSHSGDEDISDGDFDNLVTTDTVDDIRQTLEFFLQNSPKEPGRLKEVTELTENALGHIIFEDIHRIKKQIKIRRLRQETVEDDGEDSVERMIRYLLNKNADETVGRNRWGTLKTKLERVGSEQDELVDEIERLEGEIQREQNRVQQEATEFFNDWYRSNEQDINRLQELRDIDIDTESKNLIRALSNFASEMETEPPDVVREDRVREALDRLEEKLSDVDVSFASERTDIEESMDKLRRARKQWDTVEEKESSGILPFGDNEAPEERTGHSTKKTDLKRRGVFDIDNIPPNVENASFNATVTYSPEADDRIKGVIDDEITDLADTIRESFRRKLRDEIDDRRIVDNAVSNFSRLLKTTDQEANIRNKINEVIQETFEEQISDKIPSLRQEKSEKDSRREEIDSRKDKFSQVIDNFPEWNAYHTDFVESHGEFVESIRDGMDLLSSEQTRNTQVTSNYIHEMSPESIHNAIQHETLAESSLLTVESERNKVKSVVDDIIDNRFLNAQYNSLHNRNISTDDEVYTDTFVNAAVMSPAVSRDGSETSKLGRDFFDLESRLRRNFMLDDPDGGNNEEYWYVENGGPWDIGLCLYIQGISFLDNLREINHASQSYEHSYRSNEFHRSPEEALVRHAARLEDGYYIRRGKIFDINQNPGNFVEQSADDIADQLCRELEEVRVDSVDEQSQDESEELIED